MRKKCIKELAINCDFIISVFGCIKSTSFRFISKVFLTWGCHKDVLLIDIQAVF